MCLWEEHATAWLTSCRYNDIARKTVAVHRAQNQRQPSGAQQQQQRQRQGGSASLTLGQEVYRVALCTAFLLQAMVAGFVPLIGNDSSCGYFRTLGGPALASHIVIWTVQFVTQVESVRARENLLLIFRMLGLEQVAHWSWRFCRGCMPCTASTTGALLHPQFKSLGLCSFLTPDLLVSRQLVHT